MPFPKCAEVVVHHGDGGEEMDHGDADVSVAVPVEVLCRVVLEVPEERFDVGPFLVLGAPFWGAPSHVVTHRNYISGIAQPFHGVKHVRHVDSEPHT